MLSSTFRGAGLDILRANALARGGAHLDLPCVAPPLPLGSPTSRPSSNPLTHHSHPHIRYVEVVRCRSYRLIPSLGTAAALSTRS